MTTSNKTNKPNKRIAIHISGHFRAINYDNIKENILDVLTDASYDIDIFISAWKDKCFRHHNNWHHDVDVQQIINAYKPVGFEIEDNNRDYYLNTYYTDKWIENIGVSGSDTSGDAASMWYKIWKCRNMIKSYSDNYGIKYDGVFRIRPDIFYHSKLNLDEVADSIDANCIYMPQWHGKYEKVTKRMMDHYFFGSYEVMMKVLGVFEGIKDYLVDKDVVCTAEGFLYHYITSNSITCKRFNIKYSVQRQHSFDQVTGDH